MKEKLEVSVKSMQDLEKMSVNYEQCFIQLSLFFCDTHSIRWILDPNQKHPRLYYKLQRNDWCCFCNNFIPFFLFQNMENQIYRFSYDCCIGILARKFKCLYPQKSVVHKVKVWLIDIQILSKWYRFRGSHLEFGYVTFYLYYVNIDFILSEFCFSSSFKCLGQWSVLLFTSLALLYFKWLCLEHRS